jgi:hypothetical protein
LQVGDIPQITSALVANSSAKHLSICAMTVPIAAAREDRFVQSRFETSITDRWFPDEPQNLRNLRFHSGAPTRPFGTHRAQSSSALAIFPEISYTAM